MSKKKTDKKVSKKTSTKSRKVKKTTNKVVIKRRKPNSYNVIRSSVSKYCKENGARCSRNELDAIYYEIKRQYLSGKESQNLTLNEITREVDRILGFKDMDNLPVEMYDFDWFNLDYEITRNNGLFFKDDDTMMFDLSEISLGVIKTPFTKLSYVWNSQMYPSIRSYLSDMGGIVRENSIIPKFYYVKEKSNSRKRVWYWKLVIDSTVSVRDIMDKKAREGSEISNKHLKKTEKEIEIEFDKPIHIDEKEVRASGKLIDAEIELNKLRRDIDIQRNEALKMLRKDYDDKIFTVEEYKKERNLIISQYYKGV